jgi:hypothetical protein
MPCRKWKYSADEALAIVIFLLKADLFGAEAIQDRACGCLALQPEWPCQSNELLGQLGMHDCRLQFDKRICTVLKLFFAVQKR